MTTWTVVTRKNGRGQFRKTGFAGTWAEASAHASTFPADIEAWFVPAEDTTVLVNGRRVKIALTAEERAAAKAEAARVEATAQDLLGSWTKDYLVNDARAILGLERTPYGAAIALAEAGWDRPALARRHS